VVLGSSHEIGYFIPFFIMFAYFGHDSNFEASSSDISLSSTDPSRTLEALVQKNMFSRPEFLSTPQSKMQNV
jgi:hypothetical protein